MHSLFAYIDPGSGSLVIQAVIAAFVAVPFFFRSRARSLWERLRGTEPPADREGDSGPA
jgi:hypothetical protein